MSNQDKNYWEGRKEFDDKYKDIVGKNEKTVRALEERLGKEYKRVYEDMLLKDLASLYSKWQVEKDNFSLTNILRYDWINNYSDKLKDIAKELGVKEEELMENHLRDVFNTTGNDTVKRMRVDNGAFLKGNFSVVPKHFADKVMNSAWSGANYSSRIWKNKGNLVEKLKGTIMKGVLEGKSFTNMTKELQALMGSDYKNTKRLIRTETMNVINQAQVLNYKNNGIEYVRINGRNDGRACNSCISRFETREVFPIDKAPYLPSHANCRCSYIPVVDIPKTEEEKLREREEKEFEFENYEEYKEKYSNSMGAFNKKFKSDIMDKGVFEDIIYDMDKNERKIFLKHFNDIKFVSRNETSHYSVDVKNGYKGYINFDSKEFKLGGSYNAEQYHTMLHEFAHYLHLDVGESFKWWKESKIGFDKYDRVVNNDSKIIKKLLEARRNGDKNASKELDKLQKILYEEGALSDCFSALTKNEFLGTHGHQTKYWNRAKEERYKEIFAQIYDVKARYGVDSEEFEIIKKFMPESLDLYNEIISKIAKEGTL